MGDAITPSEKVLESEGWEKWVDRALEDDPGANAVDVLERAQEKEKEYIHEGESLRRGLERIDSSPGIGDDFGEKLEEEVEILEDEYDRMVEEPYIENDRWVIADERNGKPVGILNDTIRWGPHGADHKIANLRDRRERVENILKSRLPDYEEGEIEETGYEEDEPAPAPGNGGESGGNGNGSGDDYAGDEGDRYSRRDMLIAGAAGAGLVAGGYLLNELTSGGAAPAPAPGNETTTSTTASPTTTTEETTTTTQTTEKPTTTISYDGQEISYGELHDEWEQLNQSSKRELFNNADNYQQFMNGDLDDQEVKNATIWYKPDDDPYNSKIRYMIEDGEKVIQTEKVSISDDLAAELLDL